VNPPFDPGALLARSYDLPPGPRVVLRLVRVRDLPRIGELLTRQGIDPDELELARLVRFDPRRRLVVCATAPVGSAEAVVGVGAIDLVDDQAPVPSLVVVDHPGTEGLAELISEALIGRAQTVARARAA
jgi:hypothetical protein